MSSALVGSAAVTLKRSIPSCRVNLSTASATNESRVFAGVDGGHPCISHAHWRPLPPRCCLLGDEALALLSEVCVDFWRTRAGSRWLFLSLPLPGRRSRAHPGYPYLRCDCLPEHRCGFVHPPVRIVNHRAVRRTL